MSPLWNAAVPYNNLPLLPPPNNKIETTRVLKECIKARAALGELKQAAELIPNQAILINTLPLLEARASSEIENIVTTTDKLFRQIGKPEETADPATKEAIRYSRALFEGFKSIQNRPLSTKTLEEICSKIKGVEMSVRKTTGTELLNDKTGEIVYTPPEGEKNIRELLSNWEKFIHYNSELDPLIKMAIAHYQFEAIHPFSDGNGRTGRIINSIILTHENLISLPILYLSRYIIKNKIIYYELLQEITKNSYSSGNAWEDWIVYILNGVEETAIWTTNKIASIRSLFSITRDYVKEVLPKIYSHELINIIFELPYIRISNLVENGVAKRQTASVYLKELSRVGVLNEISFGKEKLFLHPKFMRLLSNEGNDIEPYKT